MRKITNFLTPYTLNHEIWSGYPIDIYFHKIFGKFRQKYDKILKKSLDQKNFIRFKISKKIQWIFWENPRENVKKYTKTTLALKVFEEFLVILASFT